MSRDTDTKDGRVELTLAMIRAGVAAYERWNSEEEEIEALVVEIFLSMKDKKTLSVRGG